MMRARAWQRADKVAQIRGGGGRQHGDAGAAGDEAALLDALPWRSEPGLFRPRSPSGSYSDR